jgi:hypothetical protein
MRSPDGWSSRLPSAQAADPSPVLGTAAGDTAPADLPGRSARTASRPALVRAEAGGVDGG